MPEYDNPAVRLHRLMTAIYELKPSKNANMSMHWPGLLGLEDDTDKIELLRRHSIAALWPSQVWDLVEEHLPPEEQDDYHDVLPTCAVVLSASISSQLDAVQRQLNDKVITSLHFCARDVSKQLGQLAVQRQQMEEWLESIYNLIEEVSGSDLPPPIRTELLDILAQLRKTIEEYSFAGSSSLRQAAENAMGSVVIALHRPDVGDAAEVANNPVVKKAVTLINGVAMAVGLVNDLHQLPATVQSVVRALPG